MNIEKLQLLLEEAGVPDELYNLYEKGRDDERFCIKKEDKDWRVYFSERGIKTIDEIFATEAEACQFVYKELID